MEASRVSDFSIQRILSPQLGSRPHDFSPDRFPSGIPAGFGLESGNFRPPAPLPVPLPVPVPVVGCVQYRGVSYGDAFYSCGTAFHHADFSGFYPTCGVFKSFSQEASDSQPLAGPQAAGASAQARQKARMRTVFTDSQTKQLEALFELTDYPAIEARAELAMSTGLSEETVRVWFKNRRARRKRQRSSSRVKSPRPASPCAAEKKHFSSFL